MRLKRVARITGGQSPSSEDVTGFDLVGLPFLQGNAEFGSDHPAPKNRCDTAPRRAAAGSILLSVRAPVGALNWADRDYGIGRGLCSVEPTCGAKRYVWWALQAAIPALRSEATGSTFEAVAVEDVAAIALPAHNQQVQRRIADFLDHETARIDALIAAKQRMIEIARDRLAAVIDRATASGELVPLKRVVNYLEGPGIGADDFRSDGVPLIRIAGMSGSTVTTQGCNYLDPETVDRRWSHFRLRRGDYVISASASMGTVAIVGEEAEGCVPYTGLIRFRPKSDRVDMGYIRMFLSSGEFRRQIDLLKTGATIQHFGPTHLDQVKVAVPSSDDQAKFVEDATEYETTAQSLTSTLTTQIGLLRERRQALITAAVTGELEV